jgi:hypothetical protein
MITNYNKYQEHVAIEMLRDEVELELFKYLPEVKENQSFRNERGIFTHSNVFLLDKDYGARVSDIYFIYQIDEYEIELKSVKFNSFGRFVDGDIKESYDTYRNKISFEGFVKNFVDRLKKQDQTRKLIVTNRELKKNMHKYNI